ncbi:chromate resistance protein ChrB domain-containing protein [Undibacterium sp. SXout7W]|uniref:chromate resistance protein ChrB domain-containing protein n=1 Tax=Undibacterium sp. SXout7W TaxID=3413049 RepID=UPI003BF2EF57
MKWILLITSLPTENATVRMRAWRALKTSGAVVLRDGVYLLPDLHQCRATLDTVAGDVISGGGTAMVLLVDQPDEVNFADLFKRHQEFSALLADIAKAQDALSHDSAHDALKQARKLRKGFATLAEIDFFPGEAQAHANAALQTLELNIARALTPDEPHATTATIPRLSIDDFQRRRWATRRRPWVDRLACAWLIRRFIDPYAQFLWLTSPEDCPTDVLGFDFDGATFSHTTNYVSVEVMLESFGLTSPALQQLGALVHYLDVGGVETPESAGIESVLAGLRSTITDDDQLVQAANSVFDGLLATFQTKENSKGKIS